MRSLNFLKCFLEEIVLLMMSVAMIFVIAILVFTLYEIVSGGYDAFFHPRQNCPITLRSD